MGAVGGPASRGEDGIDVGRPRDYSLYMNRASCGVWKSYVECGSRGWWVGVIGYLCKVWQIPKQTHKREPHVHTDAFL